MTPGGTVTVPPVVSPTPTFSAPDGFSYAGNGLYITSSMSEPFAQAIYNAYVANGTTDGAPVDLGQIYSPVTGQSYDVQCSGYGSNTGVICTNTTTGDEAQVTFAEP